MDQSHPLHQLLKKRGITSAELARMVGLAAPTVNTIGDEGRPKVSWEVAERIASALNVTVSNLFTEDELYDKSTTAGRKFPRVGRRATISVIVDICGDCHLVLPRTGICPNCEDN